MKNRLLTTFATIAALLVFLLPLLQRELSPSNAVYDSVFTVAPGSLPCLKAGRIMPISSAAADSLKLISGKSSVKIGGEKTFSTKWLFTLNFNPKLISAEAFMRSDNRDLVEYLGGEGRYFSYENIAGKQSQLYRAAVGESVGAQASAEALNAANAYELAAFALAVRLDENSGAAESVANWRAAVKEISEDISAAERENREPNRSKLLRVNSYFKRLSAIKKQEDQNPNILLRVIPHDGAFITPAAAMLEKNLDESAEYALESYAAICDLLAAGNTPVAVEKARELFNKSAKSAGVDSFKLRFEHAVNSVDPFFGGFLLYCAALLFLIAQIFLRNKAALLKIAAIFLCSAALAHCMGIAARMYIQARPPVTNLYSSVVFAGAVASLFGTLLYLRKKNTGLAVAACVAGLLSLLMAINLPYSGDTMGMMRAVLNSNFWLTTHVVTIMVGYSGIFLAGFLSSAHIVANVFKNAKFGANAKTTADTVYRILCVSLFFCFLGTMLGGVWADMSWGRFWGWDPKENGALMTLLWCAAAIHCRLLRICSERTFFAMAAFGNIIVAWGWFGVNLMGIGLHSYGFMEGGWFWFGLFVAIQIFVIILAFTGRRGATMRTFQWLILAGFALCSLFIGIADVSIFNVLSLDAEQLNVFVVSRVPRLCSILVAGSSLAISGLIMQRITRNRFVSPTTAGTMEWCRLGVMIAILCFPDASPMLRVMAAFAVSLFGTSLFLAFVTRIRQRDVILVPLVGMMLGGVVNAGSTFFAYQYDIVQNMASWLQGNFSLIIQGNYELLYLSVPFMVLAYLYADRFTIAGMGRGTAVTLGLNHANIVRMGLIIVSVISSITIVGVGYIPFVGLVVPNIVSIFRGDSVKNILFDTAWLGAFLVLICDIAGRLILYPYEIPIGIILSIVGSSIFLVLLLKRKSYA